MRKRMISLALAVLMLVTLLPTTAFARRSAEELEVSVRYCSGHGENDHDYEASFLYSDGYFNKSGYTFRQDLCNASFALALAAFSSKEADTLGDEDKNFKSLMQQCGFTDADSNEWFGKAPVNDSIGVCAANKPLRDNGVDYTLIAVGVRGNFYRLEWGGNVHIGDSGEHEGFALCREQTLAYIKEYIAKYEITGPIKIWIAGYSRAAAAANMTAGALDNGYDLGDVSLSPHDIYCYCFETPKSVMKEDAVGAVYNNIHNVINPNDLVTYLAFDCWNFDRYGVDHVLPTRGDYIYDHLKPAMVAEFDKIPNNGGKYAIDDFHYIAFDLGKLGRDDAIKDMGASVTQKEYYKILEKAMTHDFAFSREDYVESLQSSLVEILGVIFNRTELDFNLALEIFTAKIQGNYRQLLKNIANPVGLAKLLETMMFESLSEADITHFSAADVRQTAWIMAERLINMTLKDPDVVATLLANINSIISAHFTETELAWLRVLPDDCLANQQPAMDIKGVFRDVTGKEWYSDGVAYVWTGGIMNGTSATEFSPNQKMTRAMFLTVLYRMSGSPEAKGKPAFSDVPADYWARDAIAWGVSEGIVCGYNDGTFRPAAQINRQEMVTMLYRFYGSPAVSGDLKLFSDAAAVSAFAKNAIIWAIDNGIVGGYNDGTFRPRNTASRGEMAVIIQRFCEM